MDKGFIYRVDRCVSCFSCVTACKLENGNSLPWRHVISDNPDALPGLPVHNLSIACNHCKSPSCKTGCPTGAYSVNSTTGAVILNKERCMGCNYCIWNCPFDAPSYNPVTRTIEKCTFCSDRLEIGIDPACAAACPTGALGYDEIDDNSTAGLIVESSLEPRISIIAPGNKESITEVYPKETINTQKSTVINTSDKITPGSEWSLLVFTYLSSLVTGIVIASWPAGYMPPVWLIVSFLAPLLVFPLFHLSKPFRALKSLSNILNSPLSAEIAGLLLFMISITLAYLVDSIFFIGLAGICAILYTLLIDNVYIFSWKGVVSEMHPARIFLTSLAFASLLSGSLLAFLFISIIKIISTFIVRKPYRLNNLTDLFGLIYIIILMLLNLMLFYDFSGLSSIIILSVTELINRITFYMDFNPVSNTYQFINRNHFK